MKGTFMSIKKKLTAAAVVGLGVAGQAMAALPADINTAVESAKTDIASAGALVIGVVVAISVWKWIRRVF